MTIQTSRRSFLKGAAALGAVLVVGLRPDGAFAAGPASAEINPFVRITPEGVVEVVIKHFETGQGTTTGLATLAAEELDADWQRVTIDFAPADNERYRNLFFGVTGTCSSACREPAARRRLPTPSCSTARPVLPPARSWSPPRPRPGACRPPPSRWSKAS
jgi:isoquinoline 1-oxidoreductase beta subunit